MISDLHDVLHEANLGLSMLRENMPDDSLELREALNIAQSAISKLTDAEFSQDREIDSAELKTVLRDILNSIRDVQSAVDSLNERVELVEKNSRIKYKFSKPRQEKVPVLGDNNA